MTKKEILIAEDEDSIREGLALLLESEGYAVRAVSNGAEAVDEFSRRRPDCVLLDVMMPGMNGFSACKEIRARDGSVPIVFLSARDDDISELRGLGLGADDFVSKTSSEAVLLARIEKAIGRVQSAPSPASRFRFGGLTVDAAASALVGDDGRCVADLAVREVEMLRFFRDHPGEMISRDFLVNRFWGRDFEGFDNVLSVALSRLREKLGASGAFLKTVRGQGCIYNPPIRGG